jgi:hypothetical protein
VPSRKLLFFLDDLNLLGYIPRRSAAKSWNLAMWNVFHEQDSFHTPSACSGVTWLVFKNWVATTVVWTP